MAVAAVPPNPHQEFVDAFQRRVVDSAEAKLLQKCLVTAFLAECTNAEIPTEYKSKVLDAVNRRALHANVPLFSAQVLSRYLQKEGVEFSPNGHLVALKL